jgi:hypothetical protein
MPRSYKPTHGGRKGGTLTIALIAAAGVVVVIGGVAGAVTLTGGSHNTASLTGARSSHAAAVTGGTGLAGPVPHTPSHTAVASATMSPAGPAAKRTKPASSPAGSPTGSASNPTNPASSPTGSASSLTTLRPTPPSTSGGGTLAISSTGNPGPEPVDHPYPSATLTVSGGQAPYTWYTSGLPSGMTATPEGATLAIGGTPTQMCNCTLDVTVTDSAKPEGQAYDSLPIGIATSSAPSQGGTLAMSNGLSVTDTLGDQLDIGANASGGTGPYTWTVTGLPAGVTAGAGGYNNAAFGLGGAATAAGTDSFTVTLSDSSQPQQTVTGHYTLTVRQG